MQIMMISLPARCVVRAYHHLHGRNLNLRINTRGQRLLAPEQGQFGPVPGPMTRGQLSAHAHWYNCKLVYCSSLLWQYWTCLELIQYCHSSSKIFLYHTQSHPILNNYRRKIIWSDFWLLGQRGNFFWSSRYWPRYRSRGSILMIVCFTKGRYLTEFAYIGHIQFLKFLAIAISQEPIKIWGSNLVIVSSKDNLIRLYQ